MAQQLYLYYGIDDFSMTEAARRVIDKHIPKEEQDFGVEIVNGSCAVADEVVAAVDAVREGIYTSSFFGGGKAVWLRDANFLPGAKSRAAEAADAKDAVEKLLTLLQKDPLPEGHLLIITAQSVLRTTRFFKHFNTAGTVEEFGVEVKPWEMAKAAQERVTAALPRVGLKMDSACLARFSQRVGIDLRTILSELEKLKTYLKGAPVTLEAIDAITCRAVGAEPTELCDAVGDRNTRRLVECLNLCRTEKDLSFRVASQLLGYVNDLLILREGLEKGQVDESGWRDPSVIATTGSRVGAMRGFRLKIALGRARNFKLAELRAARHFLIGMRDKLVSTTQQDPWDIIEVTLLRIVPRPPARRR